MNIMNKSIIFVWIRKGQGELVEPMHMQYAVVPRRTYTACLTYLISLSYPDIM